MYSHDARNNRKTNYIYLGGSLLAQREIPMSGGSTVTIKYQHTDALGTPIATTDSAGAFIEKSEYEPYGLQVNMVGSPKDGPGYTGHVQDAATSLTYMQQRYYDPMIGRFLSVDPVTANPGNGTNFNRYWYANNNPYRFLDPDGRKCVTVANKKSCIVDSYVNWRGKKIPRAEMSKGQLKKVEAFERSYTSAVNKLMSNPSKSATLTLSSGKTATTTAGEVGKALAGRNMEVNSKLAGNGMATGTGTTYIGEGALAGKGKLEGVVPTSEDAHRELTIVHEGMHGNGAPSTDKTLLRGNSTQEQWNSDHQIPFNKAAETLLTP